MHCTLHQLKPIPHQGLAACWVVQLSCKAIHLTLSIFWRRSNAQSNTTLSKPGQERVDDSLEHFLSLAPRLIRTTEREVPQLVLVHRQRLQLTTATALEFKVL